MAQQTAMQKLLTNLESIGITIPKGIEMVYLQMEKEQIMTAHTRAYLIGEDTISIEDANIQSEQYYNEAFVK